MQSRSAVSIDVLAQEIFRRLAAADSAAASNDPHSFLLHTAAEVEAEWEGRARRTWINRGNDAIPAPSASTSALIRAAVHALARGQRELLLMHVGGLSYRQIAERTALPQEAVLHDLVAAYCQLRWTLTDQQLDAFQT